MLITAIEKGKGKSYYIFIEGEYSFALTAEQIVENGLKAGMDISGEQITEILKDANFTKAKNRALHLLSYKDYTANELLNKLNQNYEPEVSTSVVEWVSKMGFINEDDYAMRLSRDLFKFKNYSPRRIKQELMQKGIDGETAEIAVAQFEDEDISERIYNIIEKKYKRYLSDPKGVNKTINAMIRLGYSVYDIKTAIDMFDNEF